MVGGHWRQRAVWRSVATKKWVVGRPDEPSSHWMPKCPIRALRQCRILFLAFWTRFHSFVFNLSSLHVDSNFEARLSLFFESTTLFLVFFPSISLCFFLFRFLFQFVTRMCETRWGQGVSLSSLTPLKRKKNNNFFQILLFRGWRYRSSEIQI